MLDGGVVVYFHDVTDRKQTELKLRQSEALLAEAQQLAHIGSWNWEVADDRLTWSDEHYRICGLQPKSEAVTFERAISSVHPDDREATRQIVEQSVRDHQPYTCRVRLLHADGTVRIAQSRGQAEYGKGGQPIRLFGTLQDITERSRAEEALRNSEERFRRYFELGLIGMAITSPAKGILEVNDELCRILGYTRDELLEKTWADVTHADDLAIDVASFGGVMAGKTDGYTIDKRFIRKGGAIIEATISVKCVRRSDGAVDYFVALLQDITQIKRNEKALRGMNMVLEERVRQRTQELERAAQQRRLLASELARAEQEERRRLATILHDHVQQSRSSPHGFASRSSLTPFPTRRFAASWLGRWP